MSDDPPLRCAHCGNDDRTLLEITGVGQRALWLWCQVCTKVTKL